MMLTRSWVVLAVLVAGLLPLQAVQAGVQKWGGTGTVSAVTLSSQTIVVEIPRRNDSLTVGARFCQKQS